VTLAQIQATGSGRLSARVVVEGWPYEFVSARGMVVAGSATTTARVESLDVHSLKFGARADLMRASLDGDSCEVRLVDIGGQVSLAFKRPSRTSYLIASCSAADATLNVTDTSAWPASGVLHIGTEAITYTGKTATTFTGCTRGAFGSTAQSHYIADGSRLAYARVTDVPEALEGRRVFVYFYGDGDSPTGAGTLVWRGIASTDAGYERGVWKFSMESMTRLLDQELGGDINDPVPIRGIYYPVNAPWLCQIVNITSGAVAIARMTGFFADAEAHAAAATTAIANAIASPVSGTWSWSVGSSFVVLATPGGYRLVYTVGTGAGTPARLAVQRPLGADWGDLDAMPLNVDVWWSDTATGAAGVSYSIRDAVTAGYIYYAAIAAQVPRASVGWYSPGAGRDPSASLVSPTDPSADPHFLYLGGMVVPSTSMMISFEEDGVAPASTPDVIAASLADTTNRKISVGCAHRFLGPSSRIRIGRVFVTGGTVSTLRAALVSQSPAIAPTGGMPLVTSTDIIEGADFTALASAANATGGLGGNRYFGAFHGMKLGDVVRAELLVLGAYQRVNAGSIEWKRLRVVTSSDTADWTIGENDIIGWPSMERGDDGLLASVRLKTGYDPIQDKWLGRDMEVRDVEAASSIRSFVTMEIDQRSWPIALDPITHNDLSATPEAVAAVAMPFFGFFGAPYDRITIDVGMRFFGVKVGDVVSLTSSKVPSTSGTLGMAGEVCMVTGHTWDGSTGRTTLQLIRSTLRVAGYAPGFKIASQVNVAGNTWDITVTLTGYTSATDIARWFAVNDLVRVTQSDTTATTEVTGTVVSFSSTTTLRVTFGAVWTPGGSEWCLRARDATAYASTASLARFMFIAPSGAGSRIAFSGGSIDARVFS